MTNATTDPVRLRVLGVLKRFGWNATSFQILEPGFHYWFPDEDACVEWLLEARAFVTHARDGRSSSRP